MLDLKSPKVRRLYIYKGSLPEHVKGFLLTGPPGSGKTFIADTWFASLPTPYKSRKHYNEFVLDLYRGVWDVTAARMRSGFTESTPPESAPTPGWTKNIREQVRTLLKRPDGQGVHTLWDRIRQSAPALSSSSAIVPIPYILASRLIAHRTFCSLMKCSFKTCQVRSCCRMY